LPENNGLDSTANRTVRGWNFRETDPRLGHRQERRANARADWLGFRIAARVRN